MEKGLSGGGGMRKRRAPGRQRASQEGNASAAEYGLSATKHPLNNSVINSPGRLRRPPCRAPPFGVCSASPGTFGESELLAASVPPPLSPSLPPSLSLSLFLFLSLSQHFPLPFRSNVRHVRVPPSVPFPLPPLLFAAMLSTDSQLWPVSSQLALTNYV